MGETCFLIARDGSVLWGDTSSSLVAMPDSRARWEAIWECRDALAIVAHSHPVGPLGFSSEDESTMTALDQALGRRLVYAVIAPDGMVLRREEGTTDTVSVEPWWTTILRAASGMTTEG